MQSKWMFVHGDVTTYGRMLNEALGHGDKTSESPLWGLDTKVDSE